MARVIAICNQKGGVGKTTTAVNLGTYLALLGKRTLVVDFDPQGNASSALGYDPAQSEGDIYDGILGKTAARHIIRESLIFNCHFVPANQNLAGALVELVILPEREQFLRKFINQIRPDYDYILIDLPPSLSLLTVNGLVAAQEVLIPVQAEYYSLEGLGQLLHTINLINQNLHPDLRVVGAVLTMYDRRERLSQEVQSDLHQHFPHPVFDVEIPRSVALAEAPSFRKPIFLHSPYSIGAEAYRRLAEALIKEGN